MQKMPEFKTFRVSCRRAQKNLPFTSLDVERQVGGCIFHKMENVGVDLENPEVVCNIELFDNQALIYTERIEGLRGLPVGTSGKVLCLISAGIDSPVAAFRMMRRGCKVAYVHFHSYPFTDKNSIYNAIKLVKQINPYQMHSKIYIVSLAKIQERIIAMAPVKLRLLLYRRMMLRLAERVAYRERAKALITGESLGQVASQTLMNLKATSDAVKLPILRPLIGYDKQDIIDIAKGIGTFQISIEPFTDCCTYMVPENPETHAKLKIIREAEENLGDYEELLYQAIGDMEIEVIEE